MIPHQSVVTLEKTKTRSSNNSIVNADSDKYNLH